MSNNGGVANMTKSQALAEARRRWGAYAWVSRQIMYDYTPRYWCKVGDVDTVLITRGMGTTWEAAFADTDQREKGERP